MKHPLLLVMLASAALGCATEPMATGRNRLPADMIKPGNGDLTHPFATQPAPPVATEGEDAQYLNAPSIPVRTLACLLPLKIATDRAWRLTDESALPVSTRALWRANGLRLGYLPEAKWEDFRRTLNGQEKNAKTNIGVMAQQESSFMLRPFPEPLHKGGLLPSGLSLELDKTLPPRAPAHEKLAVFDNDRLQLMATATFDGKNFSGLTLTPHLHHPLLMVGFEELDAAGKPQKGPPKAWEKEAQGLFIAPLATPPLNPGQGQLLVVGLWWPWKNEKPEEARDKEAPKKSITKEKGSEQDRNETKNRQDQDDLVVYATPPPLALSIGRTLFTSYQNGSEFQVILIIKIK